MVRLEKIKEEHGNIDALVAYLELLPFYQAWLPLFRCF